MTSLDEGSARRLSTHNIFKRLTFMPPSGWDSNPQSQQASGRCPTSLGHLDRAAISIDVSKCDNDENKWLNRLCTTPFTGNRPPPTLIRLRGWGIEGLPPPPCGKLRDVLIALFLENYERSCLFLELVICRPILKQASPVSPSHPACH